MTMTDNVTKEQPFKPTPAMIVWLDKSKELMSGNVTEISEACNISRQTWYRWWENNDFKRWFNRNWESYLMFNNWQLDLIGLRKAETDYRYWAFMQDKIGRLNQIDKVPRLNVISKVEYVLNDEPYRS